MGGNNFIPFLTRQHQMSTLHILRQRGAVSFALMLSPVVKGHCMLEHPDLNKRCLSCSSSLVRILGRDGGPSQIALCTQCPLSPRVCWSCLSPLHSSTIEATPGCCSNKSCQLVSSLLNCDLVTDPKSHVRGCPEFRACPRCYSLIMHTSGCKYMCCFSCQNRFCWICLQPSEECRNDKELYWSLSCSKPTVGRQVFTT